jgi:hypothetical protein
MATGHILVFLRGFPLCHGLTQHLPHPKQHRKHQRAQRHLLQQRVNLRIISASPVLR